MLIIICFVDLSRVPKIFRHLNFRQHPLIQLSHPCRYQIFSCLNFHLFNQPRFMTRAQNPSIANNRVDKIIQMPNIRSIVELKLGPPRAQAEDTFPALQNSYYNILITNQR